MKIVLNSYLFLTSLINLILYNYLNIGLRPAFIQNLIYFGQFVNKIS